MTTSLVDVIRRNSVADAKAQIEAGADVNGANSSGTAPLHAAAFKADAELVALLLARGAAVNARDSYGCTPLHDLCASPQSAETVSAVAELLLAGGAALSKNQQGRTPVDEARFQGHYYLVDVFANHGAEPRVSTATVKRIGERLRAVGHSEATDLHVREETERLLAGEQRLASLGRLVRSELVTEGVLEPERPRSGPAVSPTAPFLSAGIQCSSMEAAIVAGLLGRHKAPSQVSVQTVYDVLIKRGESDADANNLRLKIEAALGSRAAAAESSTPPAVAKRPWWRIWS
jgi:hypothetical protein